MKDNFAEDNDSIHNSILHSTHSVKSKSFNTLLQRQSDQFTSNTPFSDKDPNETITESSGDEDEAEREKSFGDGDGDEGSQIQGTFDSEKKKGTRKKMEQGRWTNDEHYLFLEGLIKYGNEWKMVQKHIKSRTSTQARSHAQKFFIRIKKKISNERNPECIKKKIYQIFKEEMQDNFKPDNLPSFLDKIMKLVFVSELSNKKHNPFKEDKEEELNMNVNSYTNNNDNEESLVSPLNSIGHDDNRHEHNNEHDRDHEIKVRNKVFTEKDIGDDNHLNLLILPLSYSNSNTHSKKRGIKNRKESFFSIEKDREKINLKQFKSKSDKKIDINNNSASTINTLPNKSFYENYTQTIQQNNTPSCINIVNITMVNNSNNTYVQNYNKGTNNNEQSSKKKGSMRNDLNSNPFNLQFDELLFQSSSKNGNNNNSNHCNGNSNANYNYNNYNNNNNNSNLNNNDDNNDNFEDEEPLSEYLDL